MLKLAYTLEKRIRHMVTLCFRCTICSIIFQMIENEILQNQECIKKAKYENACVIENKDVSNEVAIFMDILKFGNACVSLIASEPMSRSLFDCNTSSGAICVRYHLDCHSLQLVHRNNMMAPRNVVNKNIIVAAIDLFVTGLFVPPFNSFPLPSVLNVKGTSYVRIEYWVTMASFLKLSWAYRWALYRVLDKFADSVVLRKLAHFDPGVLFAFKVCVHENPVTFLTSCWFTHLSWSAYVLRIIEAPAHENVLPLSQTLWMCTTAFTTVGYGDLVPKTHTGRFVMAVGLTIAYALISLTLVTWMNCISLKYSEKNVVKVYQYSAMKAELMNGASTLLTKWLKIVILKSKVPGRKWNVTLYWSMLEEVRLIILYSLKSS